MWMDETRTPVDFEAYRPLLFSIAYRMLGSAMDAEDMVQDAFLRAQAAPEAIRNPKSYLATVVTRLCIDQLKSARAQRETYIGPWLPEPILTGEGSLWANHPEAEVGDKETLSMAFMLLLETLSPEERAVFLMREVFDYDYADIAALVGKSSAACRQLFQRARQHISAQASRYPTSAESRQRFMQQFGAVLAQGDVQGFIDLLSEDVSGWSDTGGKVRGWTDGKRAVNAANRPLLGKPVIGKLLAGGIERMPEGTGMMVSEVNGDPALLFTFRGAVVMAMVLQVADGKVVRMNNVFNPDKLRGLGDGSG